MKVLYVEDDPAARRYVEKGLARYGFAVDSTASVEKGFERARAGDYDALIIDVSLPDGEGFDLLRRLREAGTSTPALFLSARGAVADRLRGFDTGADDYLPKPFALAELVARAHAIARRAGRGESEVVRVADLEVDLTARRALRRGRRLELAPKQWAFLELLVRQRGRVVARETIGEYVWAGGAAPRSNAVRVQASCLRKEVDHGYEPKLIHTVPGVGYVLEDRSDRAPPKLRGSRGR